MKKKKSMAAKEYLYETRYILSKHYSKNFIRTLYYKFLFKHYKKKAMQEFRKIK